MPATSNARGVGVLRSVLLVGAVLLFFGWRMVANRAGYGLGSSDLYNYHYLLDQFVFGELSRGVLPAWNPYQLCGIPSIATLEAGAFYPPYVVQLLLPTHLAMAFSALFHLLVAAFATAALASRLGLGRDAAVLAGVLFALRGTFPSFAVSPNMFAAATWLPVGAIAVLDLAERPAARAVALLATATAASLLGGHPQITIYVAYGWGTLLVAWLVALRSPLARWGSSTALFGAALGLGALVAMVQLLPSMELTRVGTRTAADLTVLEMLPMGPFTSAVEQVLLHPIAGGALSFGVSGLALVSTALLGAHRAVGLWALALAVTSGIGSLAVVTPFFSIYRAIPLLGWFRFPNRVMLLTDFAFAFLVAAGLDAVLHGRRPATRIGRDRALIGLLPIITVAALYWTQEGPGVLVTVCATVMALALALWPRRSALPTATALAIVLVALAEVLRRSPLPVSFPYRADRLSRFAAYDDTWEALRATIGHDRVWIVGTPLDPAIAPKQATRNRLRAMDDYAPINLRRQSEYFTFLTEAASIRTRLPLTFSGFLPKLDAPPGVAAPSARHRLLDLVALRYVVTDESLAQDRELQQFLSDAHYVPVRMPPGSLTIFENPHALPRAFTVYRVLPAPDTDALLARLSDPDFDPLARSFVEGDAGLVTAAVAPARGEPATFLRDETGLVELEATLAAQGFLVLSDSYFPGWQATVDEQPVPIFATNHLFRGVLVPPGRHRIRFVYHPTTIYWGAVGSVTGLFILVMLVTRRRSESAE